MTDNAGNLLNVLEKYARTGTMIPLAELIVELENARAKMKNGIRTLNTSAGRAEYEKLIYIANAPNPLPVARCGAGGGTGARR